MHGCGGCTCSVGIYRGCFAGGKGKENFRKEWERVWPLERKLDMDGTIPLGCVICLCNQSLIVIYKRDELLFILILNKIAVDSITIIKFWVILAITWL